MSRGKPTVLALGTFDGVHRGHQAILSTALTRAKQISGRAVAFTFDRHPLAVLNPAQCPPLITTTKEKEELIRRHGIEEVCLVSFDREFAAVTPAGFVERYLVQQFQAKGVVVGFDFSFGHRAIGKVDLLQSLADQHQFELMVVQPVTSGDTVISSTAIRNHLLAGDVRRAAEFLGYPFFLRGQVVPGEGRGRQLGFPTANLACPPGKLIPGLGVYAVQANLHGDFFPGLLAISSRPTFASQGDVTIELFIDGFNGDLYDEVIEVSLVERLRGIRRFPSANALQEQMERDRLAARQILR
ncbi:MAG: bifunctional riboflavin kinase/FAD synthetase [Limnochordia bacterium]